MRLFVAVNLPAAVRAGIAAAIEPLRESVPGVRWTDVDALHVTLKFLGSVEDAVMPRVAAAVATCAVAHAAIDLTIGGAGAFPDERRPRIFWLGVQDRGALAPIVGDLDVALAPLGFSTEPRAFTPHVTVGRVRGRRGATRAPATGDLPIGALHASVHVETIDLMRSQLGRGGARYECLLAARLGEGRG